MEQEQGRSWKDISAETIGFFKHFSKAPKEKRPPCAGVFLLAKAHLTRPSTEIKEPSGMCYN